jgi:hypothetical protein
MVVAEKPNLLLITLAHPDSSVENMLMVYANS